MAKVIIFGDGQNAEIVYHYLCHDSPHDIVGFTVDAAYKQKDDLFGLPIVPFEEVERQFPPDDFSMFVATSYTGLNQLRAQKYNEAKQKQYQLISYVSSKSGIIGDLEVGDNCLILENQLMQPFVQIGNNVAIFSGVLVGHHSTIGDHCWLTSGANIGGNSNIGPYCFLGMNSTVGHMVSVGGRSFIGAGALVLKDTVDKSVYIAKGTERYALDSEAFLKLTTMK